MPVVTSNPKMIKASFMISFLERPKHTPKEGPFPDYLDGKVGLRSVSYFEDSERSDLHGEIHRCCRHRVAIRSDDACVRPGPRRSYQIFRRPAGRSQQASAHHTRADA